MENEVKIINPFDTNEELKGYITKLDELRKDGESKIISLKNEIRDIKLNKQIDDASRNQIIEQDNELIEQAKVVAAQNKEEVNSLIKEATQLASEQGKEYYAEVSAEQKTLVEAAKKQYQEDLAKEKEEHLARLEEIEAVPSGASKEEVEEHKQKVKAEKILFKSKLEDIKSKKNAVLDNARETNYDAYLEKYGYYNRARNNRHSIVEACEFKYRHYLYNFRLNSWLLKNALNIIILLVFILCAIIGALDGRNLLSGTNILGILGQSSTKMFFSLGVAGLILIGGTDLSICRMTGMGASLACLLLAKQGYDTNIGWIDASGMPFGPRIVIALFVCIAVCVAFSAIAGFFTAKFKMHPFITTLSTQLVIFGVMMVLFSNVSAFNMDLGVKHQITGNKNINLIIFAIVAIMIVWFIWNKTKFGKYMYAVGGNQEAASVSGINVFWVTMSIFIMAGVLYGLGSFLEGARVGAGNANTGVGTELDAIAACVVGGISFSGGVGKISGAVLGTIIFTGLTYCFTFIGLDMNYQFIFKGIIIMAAVCLDSLKYLKRK